MGRAPNWGASVRNTPEPSPGTADIGSVSTDPSVMVERLLRTWKAGAGRITVTYGAHGDQWDIEHSGQRASGDI